MSSYQLLPPLREHELRELTESIRQFGVRVAVNVDEAGAIIDGHHRAIIADSLGLEYPKVIEKGLSDAEKRVLAAHLNASRRQLNDAQKVQLGRAIEPDVREVAETNRLSNLKQNGKPSAATAALGRTTDEVARTVGLGSGDTYERGKQVLEAVESMPDADAIFAGIERGELDMAEVRKHVHVAQNTGENEWYTPPEYIEAARQVMGGIDLDPASSSKANETVRASRYFTKDDNGLEQNWHGRVWMNPPYAQPLIAEFAERLACAAESGDIDEAIVLVNNATETAWFQRMASVASAICFPKGRIRYLDETGVQKLTPLQGQAFLYFGRNQLAFINRFAAFGVVR